MSYLCQELNPDSLIMQPCPSSCTNVSFRHTASMEQKCLRCQGAGVCTATANCDAHKGANSDKGGKPFLWELRCAETQAKQTVTRLHSS
jgi:hypothetical protein